MKFKIRVTPVLVLSGVVLVLTAAVVGLLVFIRNAPVQTRGIPPIVQLAALEADSSRWGLNFPNQYSTDRRTLGNDQRTTYGGSEAFSKLEEDPHLVKLFAGYGFSKEYNEDRGHLNSLTDVRATKRVNDKTPGTCYSCKSADNPKLWAEMGMAAYDKIPSRTSGSGSRSRSGAPTATRPTPCAWSSPTRRSTRRSRPRARTGRPFPARRCARWCAPTAT